MVNPSRDSTIYYVKWRYQFRLQMSQSVLEQGGKDLCEFIFVYWVILDLQIYPEDNNHIGCKNQNQIRIQKSTFSKASSCCVTQLVQSFFLDKMFGVVSITDQNRHPFTELPPALPATTGPLQSKKPIFPNNCSQNSHQMKMSAFFLAIIHLFTQRLS